MSVARLITLFILFFIALPAQAEPPRWQVMNDASTLGFSFTQEGQEYKGVFQKFTADIRFDPNDLAASDVAVDVDLGSVDAGNKERNDALFSSDWFYIKKFPMARFESKAFRQVGEGRYETDARLSIRGLGVDIVMPFTLAFEGDNVKMMAEVPLQRLDFGLGEGFWASPEFIGL